jgi:hypothetical protein
MKFIQNVLFWTTSCSGILAALHPLTFIQSAHVRRSLSLTDSHGVEGNESIQDLLKEMDSLKMGVSSAMEEIEAMTEGNPQAISREIKSLKFATMYINGLKESIRREMKIEGGVHLLRPDDRQHRIELAIANAESHSLVDCTTYINGLKESIRREMKIERGVHLLRTDDRQRQIELAIANAESHPLLDCESYVVLEAHYFYRIDPDGWDNGGFDCRSFISDALSMFRINSGIALPTDVAYDHSRGFYVGYSSRLKPKERKAKLVKFQTTIMIFFQTLLGSQLCIEKDFQGKIMMFCD